MDVINIRESLLDIDRKTYCKYDLTTLYEACNLDDQNKKKLVQYIASYEHPSVIGKFLETNAGPMMEAVADDLTDAETTKVIDDINDGTERTLWNLLDQADEEDKKLSEDVNWRTAPSNSKEVSSYVYRKIKMHDDLTSDDSRYWDFDRCVREGDDAKLVKSAPKGAKYSFSLVNGDVDIDLYMGYGASEDGSDCWFVVDNNPDSDAVIEMCEEAEPSYRDKSGILGIPGERYTMSQLDDIWEQGRDSDPSIMAYKGNRNAWFNDTLRHMDESATINGEESLDEEWSEKDVEFNDRYFPRVDINDKSRYDYIQYKGKHFAYDKKHNVLMYLFQDEEELEHMGADAPWREMEGVGLSAEHWNDKEARQGYLDEWIFEMDAETSYMMQDFIQNELPHYQKDGVMEESYRDIDTIINDLGGIDSVRSRIAAAREAYPGIDDGELVDMLCDDSNSEDWMCAIEYLEEGVIGDMARVGKAAIKAAGKKIAGTDFYKDKVQPKVDKAKQKIADTKKKIADSDVGKAARDAYDKTGTKRKMNSARNVRDYKKRIANATTFEEIRAILDDMKVTNSKALDKNHRSTRGFTSPHEVGYLKSLIKKRCKQMDIQMPKSLGEAVEPTVLTCRLEVYDRYGGGGARKLRVRGADEHAALVSLLGKIRTYLYPQDAEGMSVDQILQSLEESNGDGCDYITELKNETTGEVLLAGDAEMDWEEYGINEEISTDKTTAKNESLLSEWFVGEPDPTGRLEGEARANMNKPQSWTDVYKQFLDVVDSSEYDNIQDNVEALYRKHKGEPAWDEAWRRWNEGDDYIAEAVATAERPMSKMAGTLSSVLLAHKDEVETLFDVRSAIEFLDRIRPEVKNVGYVDRVKSDLMRKRGANPIQYFWNIILKGDGEGTDKGGASSTPRSKIKKWARESVENPLTESWVDDINRAADEGDEYFMDDTLYSIFSDKAFAIVEKKGFTDVFAEPSTQNGMGEDFFWAKKDGVSYRGSYDFQTEQDKFWEAALNAKTKSQAINACAKVYAEIILSSLEPDDEDEETTTKEADRPTSGTTGDCMWKLDGTHLIIYGEGAMEDYIGKTIPWGSSITSVTIEDGVTAIGVNAFFYCGSLKSVSIPNSVTNIEDQAFINCESLATVTIPHSVTSIGGGAFRECKSLASVAIGDSVTSIGPRAFEECSALTSVTIGDSVTSIGWQAFDNCRSLTSLTIPDSVTTIGERAFWNCKSLTSIIIPHTVTSIGVYAFKFCDNLDNKTKARIAEIQNKNESLKEEVNSNDDVTLEYYDLEGYSGCFELNIGWDEFVESVQDDVLTDMVSDEEFEAHSPDGMIADQEWLNGYIRSNADEIFRRYEKELLDQFRDIAQERADEEMADNPFDDDPRWEPEYWEESWNWKNESFKVGDRVKQAHVAEYNVGTVKKINNDNGIQYEVEWDYSEGPKSEILDGQDIAPYSEEDEKKGLYEEADGDENPYTHTQVFDELKLETRNFTIDGDTIQYYHESEANSAVKILKKHYTTVEGPTETTDEWFRIEFSGKKRSKKTESVDDEVVHLDLSADDKMVDIDLNESQECSTEWKHTSKDGREGRIRQYDDNGKLKCLTKDQAKEIAKFRGHDEDELTPSGEPLKEEWNKEWDNIGIEIEKEARAQNISVDFISTDRSVMGAFKATFEINRGDWKHDHLAFDEVVKEYLANNEKYALWKIDTNEIGSSLDDCYSAEHVAFIVPKDKMELLNSMRGLFAESVNPAELTDCPECGGASFDSKRGRCTKCSYREALENNAELKGYTIEKQNNYYKVLDDNGVTLDIDFESEADAKEYINTISDDDIKESKSVKKSLTAADYLDKYCQASIKDTVRDYLTDEEFDEISSYIGSDGTVINCVSGDRCDIKFSDGFIAHQIPLQYLDIEICESIKGGKSSVLGEGFDDDFSDEELANIYGGDTKNDTPDGLETPDETEARLNESADPMIYLFPELSEDDRVGLLHYNLRYLGKNYGPDGSENNSVVLGTEADLRAYAEKDLGYELHPDYLYYEDDFAGRIVKEDLQ